MRIIATQLNVTVVAERARKGLTLSLRRTDSDAGIMISGIITPEEARVIAHALIEESKKAVK